MGSCFGGCEPWVLVPVSKKPNQNRSDFHNWSWNQVPHSTVCVGLEPQLKPRYICFGKKLNKRLESGLIGG